jgi:hypothetical protein
VCLWAPYGYFEQFATMKRKKKKLLDFAAPFIHAPSGHQR